MTQEDLIEAVKLFGGVSPCPMGRIDDDNLVTIRSCSLDRDLITIQMPKKEEIDIDVLIQLRHFVQCLNQVQEEMRPCPKCSKKATMNGCIGRDEHGNPIASVYEEYYRCDDCGHSWFYRPYARQ